ncbi:MAG: hypothetical protein ACW98Y_13825 [Candidatus Thorarchaeota archaeon]|jgi:RNA polymerase subunit RPABC4/transcription elongation factor Spt4
MASCDSCGGNIDANESVCPYCGASIMKWTEVHTGDRTYTARQDADGMTRVSFGDGKTGRRLPSGKDNVSSRYRAGTGSSGNVSAGLVTKLDELHHQIRRIPDPKHGGSKDMGVTLIEAFATMSDILSFYQDGISQEASLDTDDRKRLSKKENRVIPKLRELVHFCERVDSRTKKKMGLSNSDVRRLKDAAVKIRHMAESSICSRCGTMNKPEKKSCQNCGLPLYHS